MNIDYAKLTEITVKSQSELDMIPDNFAGRIYIEFGVYGNRAVVKKRYARSVVARGNSSVVAWDNSSVEAWDNSSVEARGNSSVEAWDNSSVVAWDNSSVEARGNSSVVAWDNSSVEARGNSSVVANANVQVVDRQIKGRIQIAGNARIVHMPKSIHEFMDFYGVKHDKKKAVFYKAVHKIDGAYQSDHNGQFTYAIGETKHEKCDANTDIACSHGLHIAHLGWALNFGSNWDDLAILEVETDIDKIVMPTDTDGKVRTSELTVLREVPLSECGVYGKILANRNVGRING